MKKPVNIKLLDIRKSLNLLQREVAEKAGISREYYTQIETGERVPSLPVASKISEALGLSLDDFFSFLG